MKTATAAELRELIAALERSGMAARRADARALLESSRALLRAQQRHRAAPSGRKLAGKLGMLLVVMLDGVAAMGAGVGALGGWLGGLAPPMALAMALGGLIWASLRSPGLRGAVAELARIALYHLAWAHDWFAEAFSSVALARLEARLTAREVMAAWRYHRRLLPRRASLEDVEDTLRVEYGEASARAFAGITAEMPPGLQARLRALRWSALMSAFEAVARSGALNPPEPLPEPEPPPQPEPAFAEAPPELIPPEPPGRIARRDELREMIRRKRADITTAYSWKLKTHAEINQRELHVDELKADIAALERELAEFLPA